MMRDSERLLRARAQKIFVLTPEGRDLLLARGAKRVEVIPHGIRSYEPARLLFSSEDGLRHVGCFGFLNATRCVLELVAACEQLKNTILHLYMCTERVMPDRGYEARVRERVARLEWVELICDYLPLDEVVWRLSRCDVNVYLSSRLDHYSASGAIGQYVAARRPIVASDSFKLGEIREFVHIVKQIDPLEIAEAIRDCRSSPGSLETYLTDRDWVRISAEYDWSNCTIWIFKRSLRKRVTGFKVSSTGSAERAMFSPEVILRDALALGAIRIIFAHNHPSGDPSPSEEDIESTRRLKRAGDIVGIPLLDGLVIGHESS
jgi:RadC-like JAB domain